jgi:hypothetical protein
MSMGVVLALEGVRSIGVPVSATAEIASTLFVLNARVERLILFAPATQIFNDLHKLGDILDLMFERSKVPTQKFPHLVWLHVRQIALVTRLKKLRPCAFSNCQFVQIIRRHGSGFRFCDITASSIAHAPTLKAGWGTGNVNKTVIVFVKVVNDCLGNFLGDFDVSSTQDSYQVTYRVKNTQVGRGRQRTGH